MMMAGANQATTSHAPSYSASTFSNRFPWKKPKEAQGPGVAATPTRSPVKYYGNFSNGNAPAAAAAKAKAKATNEFKATSHMES